MTWETALKSLKASHHFRQTYNQATKASQSHTVYPPKQSWFKALELTPLESVKIVILGQDPYHQKYQAMGLAFSVSKNVPIPPSLRNIYKELHDDIGLLIPNHGDLTKWAKAGVLLLNTTLTVEDSKPGSHKDLGWNTVTDTIIKVVSKYQNHVVFMLWGSHARSKKRLIDASKHLVLEAPHPSPLSAYRGFFGCKHFSKANTYLKIHDKTPVNFEL
ncbi:MAG: uracil-DNA glycosylase [Bacillota bacterium]